MKSGFRRLLAALLALLVLPAGALALTGQSITTFETYYQEDITYINDTAERHMLAKELTELDLEDNGRTQYYYYDDILQVTVAADASGIIESCEIRLLYPQGAAEGNSLYLDFVAANYHCIAFIMAMHTSSETYSRYLLADEIKTKLAANNGAYERLLGSYSISCISVIGEGAVFIFTNTGLQTNTEEVTDGQTPADEQTAPDEIEEDEAANYG
ncbi:MAG TPA: hypothetical protein PK537_06430 [Candidatus Limiplasma sp.]|nr:hypothetical protein [Candidatus Limiplasma sp.]